MIGIRKWLEELGLEGYADAFEHNDVDLDLASDLEDRDLKELGVASLGHRKRLLRAQNTRSRLTSLSQPNNTVRGQLICWTGRVQTAAKALASPKLLLYAWRGV